MSEELRRNPDGHEREEKLENELADAHAQEEKLERELEYVQELEQKIETELDEEHHHSRDKFFLIFIINGEDFKIEVNESDLLRVAVEKALIESGNTGRRNPAEWEVRNSEGVLLEMAREIKELRLTTGARLFLSLKVGAGGSHASRS